MNDSSSRPVRVAYLGSSASPHNQRWTAFLSRHFELRMFSLEPAEIEGVDVWHGSRSTGTAFDYLLARRRMIAAIRAFQPDLVHAHRITSYGFIGAAAARAMGRPVPFILSVWGEDVFSFPRKSPFHRAFTARILSRADQILSTSRIMKTETLRYIAPRREIYVTPFGVDTARFLPRDRSTENDSTESWTPRPTRVVVGTVKKLRDRYGVDVLLRAVAAARARLDQHDVQAVIVGEGPQRAELEALVQELGIADSVTFTGRVPHEQVPATLGTFDIFAALSLSDDESFGVAMIEASAMALPVLSTRVGGIPEVVLDGETGLLVPPGDVNAAADAIIRLSRDAELRRQMGARGRTFVRDTYDWNTTADHMRAIYREVYERTEQ